MFTLYLFAVLNLVIGVPMVLFPRPLSVGFCRLGKAIFRSSPLAEFLVLREMVEHAYNEQRAPRIFVMLGTVYLLQGLVFLILALVI